MVARCDLDWLPVCWTRRSTPSMSPTAGPGLLRRRRRCWARASRQRWPARCCSTCWSSASRPALDELRRFARVVEVDAQLLTFPWDLITANGEQIVRDLPLLIAARPAGPARPSARPPAPGGGGAQPGTGVHPPAGAAGRPAGARCARWPDRDRCGADRAVLVYPGAGRDRRRAR